MSSVYVFFAKKETRGKFSDATETITRLEVAGTFSTLLPGG
jgi:hypothetical protein